MKPRLNASVATILVMGLIVMTSSGCGFLMTTSAPANHEQLPMFSCTESNVGPGLDAVMTGLQMLQVAMLVSERDEYYWDKSEVDRSIGISAALGLIFGISSTEGFRKTKECREAKEQMFLRLTDRRGVDQPTTLLPWHPVSPRRDALEIGQRMELGRLNIRVSAGDTLSGN